MNDLTLAIFAKEAYSNNITSINHKVTKLVDEETGTKAFILSNDFEQAVIFCGTEISIEDIKTDLNFLMENGVHKGFLGAYKSIESELNQLLNINKATYFAGHSLGGALAILAYFSLDKIRSKKCVTFGSPRVFSKEVAKRFINLSGNITRYEAKGDPVPYLPPYLMGYRHIGNSVTNGSWFDLKFKSLKEQAKSHSIINYLEEFHYDF